MFKSISFTFLCALAFISWSLLCYLHVVDENQNPNDYFIEVYTEGPRFKDVPKYCPLKSTEKSLFEHFMELLFGYGIVLAFTIVLSKILQWIETQSIISLQRNQKISLPFCITSPKVQHEEMKRVDGGENVDAMKMVGQKDHPAKDENIELRKQLNDLQARCCALQEQLYAVNSTEPSSDPSNGSFSDSDSDGLQVYEKSSEALIWKQPVTLNSSGLSVTSISEASYSVPQNIYVTHSHFHFNFNGPVHLTEQKINFDFFRPRKLLNQSEFLQAWGTFIKCSLERPLLTGVSNILM